MCCRKFIAYCCAAVLISVMAAGCKPRPIAAPQSAAPETSAPHNFAAAQSGAAQPAAAPEVEQANAHSPRAAHEHTESISDINAVADKIDPQTKAQLERLIEQREQAQPEVESLAGGGERVQLNGSHSSIAVAVANEDGQVTVYHHGENLRPKPAEASTALRSQTAEPTVETVKPYPPVKKINAPTAKD